MTASDIVRFRRARSIESRRLAREAYIGAFSWDIRITWPPGFWGTVWKIVLMLAPVGFLVAVGFLEARRRPASKQPGGAA